jgi:hypothetical protein
MSRGLSSANITSLSQSVLNYEALVEITTGTGEFFAYTTGANDITMSTSTSGSTRTYAANNSLVVATDMKESYILGDQTYELQFEVAEDTLSNRFLLGKNNIRVAVHIMFDKNSTNLIQLYDAFAYSLTISGGGGQPVTIQISSRPLFRTLERTKNRTNSLLEPNPGLKIVWGDIVDVN